MHNIARFFLKCLLSVLKGGKVLKICWLGQFPVEKETDGKSCGCQGKRCEVCTFLEEKKTFTNKEVSDTCKVREGLHLNYNSENVIYLNTFKKCKNQYLGCCITRFSSRFNNYLSYHRKFVGAILSLMFHFTFIFC